MHLSGRARWRDRVRSPGGAFRRLCPSRVLLDFLVVRLRAGAAREVELLVCATRCASYAVPVRGRAGIWRIVSCSRRAGLAWAAFLREHATGLLACDFIAVKTVRLCTLYVLFFLEVPARRVCVADRTAHPTAVWVTQQTRDAHRKLETAGTRPRVLIRDRDASCAPAFDAVFAGQGARVVRTRGGAERPTPSPSAGWAASVASASTGCW